MAGECTEKLGGGELAETGVRTALALTAGRCGGEGQRAHRQPVWGVRGTHRQPVWWGVGGSPPACLGGRGAPGGAGGSPPAGLGEEGRRAPRRPVLGGGGAHRRPVSGDISELPTRSLKKALRDVAF